ncbi:MAG: hypothetical protein QXZ17_11485 [Nitrososphaerota archaeon]
MNEIEVITRKMVFEEPSGTGTETTASKLENNNEKEFSKREVKK